MGRRRRRRIVKSIVTVKLIFRTESLVNYWYIISSLIPYYKYSYKPIVGINLNPILVAITIALLSTIMLFFLLKNQTPISQLEIREIKEVDEIKENEELQLLYKQIFTKMDQINSHLNKLDNQ